MTKQIGSTKFHCFLRGKDDRPETVEIYKLETDKLENKMPSTQFFISTATPVNYTYSSKNSANISEGRQAERRYVTMCDN